MSKQFIKINSASNEDGNDLFNAICKDVFHKKSSDLRIEIGLNPAQKVTTKDVITLIQEYGLECEIIVKYDPELALNDGFESVKKSDDSDPF